MTTLQIGLDIPDAFVPRAEYALRFLSASWGLVVEIRRDVERTPHGHLLYTRSSKDLSRAGQVVVRFDERLYDPMTVCEATVLDGHLVWCRQGEDPMGADLIAGIFRLLTLADELQINPGDRDVLGNFSAPGLPAGRRSTLGEPLADYHAALLLDRLLSVAPELRASIAPRWPNGKRYAVCVSHDSDAMHRGHPREVATAFAKALMRRNAVFWAMACEAVKHRHAPMKSPFWGFDGWRDAEALLGIRSCFYLAVRPLKVRRRLNDCKSDALVAGVDWTFFRELRSAGWEIGLHPAIDAQKSLEEIQLAKQSIEERLGSSIKGIRHHYLAIDNLRPWETFRKHLAAGFTYDSSLGWHDRPGFRAGTALPFHPYDPQLAKALDLIQLPLALMDCQVVGSGVDAAAERSSGVDEVVRRVGGMLMLNWHTESYCSRFIYSGYRALYDCIVTRLHADADAWFATPEDIAVWWSIRTARLNAQ